MRDNWERGGAAPEEEEVGVVMGRRIGGGEGASSMETHKPSSLAGAGYNATQ